MRTIYETIWSIVGVVLLVWFACTFVTQCQMAAALPNTPVHQKQTIDEFLNDHPDIKQRVEDMRRQQEADLKYNQS